MLVVGFFWSIFLTGVAVRAIVIDLDVVDSVCQEVHSCTREPRVPMFCLGAKFLNCFEASIRMRHRSTTKNTLELSQMKGASVDNEMVLDDLVFRANDSAFRATPLRCTCQMRHAFHKQMPTPPLNSRCGWDGRTNLQGAKSTRWNLCQQRHLNLILQHVQAEPLVTVTDNFLFNTSRATV